MFNIESMASVARILFKLVLLFATILFVAGCDPVKRESGYRLDPEQIEKVEPGVATKDDVIANLGSPSSISTFPERGEAWYYISKKTEHFAFLEKDVIEQNVMVIKFDTNDIVAEVKNYNKDDAREVEMVERETPTGGNELSFLEQLFGNFGRFNPEGSGGGGLFDQ